MSNLRKKIAAGILSCTLLSTAAYAAPANQEAAAKGETRVNLLRDIKDATIKTDHRDTYTEAPVYPEQLPGRVNKDAINKVKFSLEASFDDPLYTDFTNPEETTILGEAEATQGQMVNYIREHNATPLLNCSIEEIVRLYYLEAEREGIRPDIALCQALKETGFFAYGGDVSPAQNNFCGLGAIGNHEPGASFATPQLGVRAHIQHLLSYTSRRRPEGEIVDPRYWHIVNDVPHVFGHVTKWTGLNGIWAVPGTTYGQDILNIWQQAKAPDGSDASAVAAQEKLNKNKNDAASLLYHGIVEYKRQNYTVAQDDFQKVCQLLPKEGIAIYDLALCLTKQGKTNEALSAYNELTRTAPTLYQGWYNRAMLRYQKGDYNAAIKDLTELIELVPQQANGYNLMAICQLKQGKYNEAWATLRQAAAINSTNWHTIKNQIIFNSCIE